MGIWLQAHPVLDGLIAGTGIVLLVALILLVAVGGYLWACRIRNGHKEFTKRPLPEFRRMQAGKLVLDFRELAASTNSRLTQVEIAITELLAAEKEAKRVRSGS